MTAATDTAPLRPRRSRSTRRRRRTLVRGPARPGCAPTCSRARSTRSLTLVALLLVYVHRPAAHQVPVHRRGLDRRRTATPACRTASAARSAPAGPSSSTRIDYFIYGSYPVAERWRVDIFFAAACRRRRLAAVARGAATGRSARSISSSSSRSLAFVLLTGSTLARPRARPDLALGRHARHLVVSTVGIVFSLPLGILLALGRRSKLPIVQHVLGDLHRVRARRAADHRAVHGEHHAAAVPAGRRDRRPAAARR